MVTGRGHTAAAMVAPRRAWPVGVLVACAALAVVAPLVLGGIGPQIAAAGVLAAATLAVGVLGCPPGIRAVLFADVCFVLFAAANAGGWPAAVSLVLVATVPLAALLTCSRVAWLRPAAPWLRPGRASWGLLALAIGTIVLAGIGLTAWTVLAGPELSSPYLDGLSQLPTPLAVAAIAGFAVVNPIWEEALFRGVLLEELAATWGVPAAVAGQAVLFGAAHWAGFPSGWVGMLLAAAWGLVLGILRVRSGGIGLSYGVHVCANATIGTLALMLL